MTRSGGRRADGRADGDEDTRAILSRRAFLIEAALANAGLALTVSACREPQPCLSVGPTPRPCLTEREPERSKPAPVPRLSEAPPVASDATATKIRDARAAGADTGPAASDAAPAAPSRVPPKVCLTF